MVALGAAQVGADLISEDGLPTCEANEPSSQESLDPFVPGFIFVTEDILSNDVDKWSHRLETIYSTT